METSVACAPQLSLRHHPLEYDETSFLIDDLLDFDNDDIGAPIGKNWDEDNENNMSVDSTEASVSVSAASASASLDGMENPFTDQALASDLYVPMDALADLEWLSPYMTVDDFSSELQAAVPPFDVKMTPKRDDETKASQQKNILQGFEEKNTKDSRTCSLGKWIPSVRTTARRSKRSRTGGRVWTSGPLLPKRSMFESHSSIFTFTPSDSSSATSRPPLKKTKVFSKKSQELVPQRRCTHCLVQKTPQWRAGPHGPKTLCNACGVRYKSGRLLPEYRPAISPTFHSEVHSNSHRKVLELRRQKEEHEKFEQLFPQISKNVASEKEEQQNFEEHFPQISESLEDEEDRREHSTVTEDTCISC